jgi:putative phosphoesterase
MRIALISDIHGNLVALDAVLADAFAVGVDAFWFVGDFSAIGPEPVTVLDRVAGLPGARFTRGNTDRYIVTGEAPLPTLDTVRSDPALIPTYAGIAASLGWTRGYVTACGWFDWLERLPLEMRLAADGVRILAVHAAPGTDDGEGVHPGRSNAELRAILAEADADIVLVGHTHEPMIRRVDHVLLVNLGAVSNPRSPDLRACYVMLELTSTGVAFVHRRVPYDHTAFTESVSRSRHPAAEFILSFQRGERPGYPPHGDHTPLTPGQIVRFAPLTP